MTALKWFRNSKQLSDQKGLKSHIQIVHEGVRYTCNLCDKQYTQQTNLNKHIKYVHQGLKYAGD